MRWVGVDDSKDQPSILSDIFSSLQGKERIYFPLEEIDQKNSRPLSCSL